MKTLRFAYTLFTVLMAIPLVAAPVNQAFREMSRETLADKIRGGWAGQMIGVSYGAPTEFKAKGKILDTELKWAPDRVSNAINQDDLYVEMTFARVMDTVGLDASTEAFGEAFKVSQYSLWHANAGGRKALNRGIKAPLSGHPKYNIHANDIDFQIEADFIGLMTPGMPRVSNEYCDRVGHVMNYGDGVYGGMFVCGMYATAFVENDRRKIVEAGLACIPSQSTYAQVIQDLLSWSAAQPNDWRKVWQLLEDKWDKNDPCPDGALEPFNIDASLNGAYIAMGVLFGDGDFLKTMEISTRCGQDSDCNPSSAVGVLGVMLGYDKIPEQFKSGIPKLADRNFQFTEYSFNTICESTLKRALALIEKNGGKASPTSVSIPLQTPVPAKLEQWNPGIPDKKVGVQDASWKWGSGWTAQKDGMRSSEPGSEVTLKFNGVAVALMGRLDQAGGKAKVLLDGQDVGQADAYIVERTTDRCLWHTYDLKPGEHVLTLKTIAEADPRSKGRQVTISQAVIYRAP